MRHADTISGVWSVLAAVIPSLGALAVAGSVLLEQARLAHEHRVRHRIAPLVWERHQELFAQASRDGTSLGDASIRSTEYETWLLELNGIHNARPTYEDMDVDVAMTGPLMPPREVVRQWVLLVTALIGIACLGVDLSAG